MFIYIASGFMRQVYHKDISCVILNLVKTENISFAS